MNANDYVWVKLTQPGLATLDAYYKEVQRQIGELVKDNNYEPARFPIENGFHRFQMWILMHVFGPSMYNGNMAPFEENIIHLSRPTQPISDEACGLGPASQAVFEQADQRININESPVSTGTEGDNKG